MSQTSLLSVSYTTALRGIAILLVITQHVVGGRFLLNYFTPCGGIGVALFLILSGYGLNESWKKKGLEGFWKGKILRVWIPYLLWISFVTLYSKDNFGLDYLLDVSLLKTSYWYIGYLFWWYAIFYVVYKIQNTKYKIQNTKYKIQNTKYKIQNIRLLILLAIALILLALDSKNIRCEQSLSFVFGVFLSCKNEQLAQMRLSTCMKIAIPALIIGVIALAVKQTPLLREVSGSIYWNITELLIKFPVAVSILFGMLLFRDKLANSAILSLLGTISLELYLVHMYFLKVIESPIDIVPFFALSLALAYSFFKFNSLYKSIQLPFKKPSPQTP